MTLNYLTFYAMSACLLYANSAFSDELPSGRISSENVEFLNSMNRTPQNMKGIRPLDALFLSEILPQEKAELICESYEPDADLVFHGNTARFRSLAMDDAVVKEEITLDAAISYQGTLTYWDAGRELFGVLNINAPVFNEENICQYGLEHDDGYLTYISTVYHIDGASYAGCCNLR